jgi:pre-rRNA-processing protein IPI3
VSAAQSHVQKLTALVVDPTSHFLLSGSADSNVIVWSIASLVALPKASFTSFSSEDPRGPAHVLSNHRAAITGIATGHSHPISNIAVSVAEDKTAIVWQYSTGTALRTYLLGGIPRCVEMDAADRAFYTAYDDGSVQILDFYGTPEDVSESGPITTSHGTPIQAPASSRWYLPTQTSSDKQQLNSEAALCLTLSFDASRLLSGHANGKIRTWNVGRGQFHADLCTLPGAVSNLSCLPPTGFTKKSVPKFRVSTVIKPRVDLGNDVDMEKYFFNTEFPSDLKSTSTNRVNDPLLKFEEAFNHTSFPKHMLWEGIEELESWKSGKSFNKASESNGTTALEGVEDYISLEEEKTPRDMALEEQNNALKDQLQSLQNTQKESFKLLAKLRKENTALVRELERKDGQR